MRYFIRKLELVSDILWMIIEQSMTLVKISFHCIFKTEIEVIYKPIR